MAKNKPIPLKGKLEEAALKTIAAMLRAKRVYAACRYTDNKIPYIELQEGYRLYIKKIDDWDRSRIRCGFIICKKDEKDGSEVYVKDSYLCSPREVVRHVIDFLEDPADHAPPYYD